MTEIQKKGGKFSCFFSVYRQVCYTKKQEKCFTALLGKMAQKNSFKTAARSPASLPESAAISVMDSRTISPKLLPPLQLPFPSETPTKKGLPVRQCARPGDLFSFMLCAGIFRQRRNTLPRCQASSGFCSETYLFLLGTSRALPPM